MTELFVAKADELAEGDRRFVDHNDEQIGVMRVKGELVAYLNVCPHQGGPVCDGMLVHGVKEIIDKNKCYLGMHFDTDSLHIVCPWHGWEFNAVTGASAGDGKWHLRKFDVIERAGQIYVKC